MTVNLIKENEKLVKEFGAKKVSGLKDIPDFYTFEKGLIYSHREFDKFYQALKKGEKCAIVSGVNASGTLHLGHKALFDTILYFQKKFNVPFFVPISDDESYVSKKVETQEQGLENSIKLAKELLAYGFDAKKTYFIIDQVYTNIYNLAIKLSRKINLSEVKATYGYKNEENIGLHFYPSIQAAHILFPQEKLGIKNVLVPIGPDEDAHIRICRDVAPKFGYTKPSIIHLKFLPGLDGDKMSKSKENGIFFNDSKKEIETKIKRRAFSGGQDTIQKHRELGGNPEVDISCFYLTHLFLDKKKGQKLEEDYKSGKILSSEVKDLFIKEAQKFILNFQKNLKKVSDKELKQSILQNKNI